MTINEVINDQENFRLDLGWFLKSGATCDKIFENNNVNTNWVVEKFQWVYVWYANLKILEGK